MISQTVCSRIDLTMYQSILSVVFCLFEDILHNDSKPYLKMPVFQKEHEQRRRRKSKAQFFEMIQEIRRYCRTLIKIHIVEL